AAGSYPMTAVAADYDNDGWPDIYVACDSTPSWLFRNQHDGTFREEGLERGVALSEDGLEQAGMGIGIGDYDLDGNLDIFKTHFADDTNVLYRNDGNLDILVMNMNEPPSLLRNDVSGSQHWLKVLLVGVQSNRSAIGSRVIVRYGNRRQLQEVTAQSSFYSANDRRLHFGLGAETTADL